MYLTDLGGTSLAFKPGGFPTLKKNNN